MASAVGKKEERILGFEEEEKKDKVGQYFCVRFLKMDENLLNKSNAL